MPTDTAHLPALLEILPEDARQRLGFYYCDKYGEWRHQDREGLHCSLDGCEYFHLAAVCFEVAKWLHLENGVLLRRDCDGFWNMLTFWDSPNRDNDSVNTKRLDCADSEPAALVAACREVGK